MFSILRNRLGIPGVISVIALVFAMLGGAYAANNSGGGEATASAKAKRGPKGPKGAKGDPGATGPQGPAGPAGAKGDKGDTGAAGAQGAAGDDGTNGAPGTSVTNETEPPGTANCGGRGGAKFKVGAGATTFACTGAQGATGPTGTTLPPGMTETGTWSGQGINLFGLKVAISYPLELTFEPTFNYVTCGFGTCTPTAACPSTSVSEPKAEDGQLCVYQRQAQNVTVPPTDLTVLVSSKTGALMEFPLVDEEAQSSVFGTWAVKAAPAS